MRMRMTLPKPKKVTVAVKFNADVWRVVKKVWRWITRKESE